MSERKGRRVQSKKIGFTVALQTLHSLWKTAILTILVILFVFLFATQKNFIRHCLLGIRILQNIRILHSEMTHPVQMYMYT